MKIAVCVKIVEGELNPFDECALEEALKIENSEVYVVSMCPLSAKDKLLSLTRLGVKKVYLLCDKAFAGSDTLATSYILSEFVSKLGADYVFCGRQTIDGDTAQVGPCLATKLGFSLITNVMKINNIDQSGVVCDTRLGQESANKPCLLTIERINTLRFPSIRSKVGEIEIIDNSTLNCDVSKIGLSGSPTKVLKTFENDKGFRKCKFVDAKDFYSLVENEKTKTDKTIFKSDESDVKFENVVAVGEVVAQKAKLISKTVTVIDMTTPEKIAEKIKELDAKVVLWNADLLGRRFAPVVSALLETGLCADCTHLECDGEKLFMFRPAKSGNILAKIKCDTYPQMATVRCDAKSDDVIVSAGRGVIENLDKVRDFAEKMGAVMCTSRPVVDKNLVPYEMQVGLTGKNVSPKVYVAIGISGAVQHTCAIENAKCVIAVNPDKNAQIFSFADFGIVDTFENFLNNINS